ncbi:MAG: Flagellar L-ring protein [Phycisphaerae bacterium]|nr:Flagellar L-ring protein [Phycisphaerae bacterium]
MKATVVIAAALTLMLGALAPDAAAQSSSMFNRAEQGQFGSNVPMWWAYARQTPALPPQPTAPAAAGGTAPATPAVSNAPADASAAAATAAGAVIQAVETAAPPSVDTTQAPALPPLPATGSMAVGSAPAAAAPAVARGVDASATPAVTALQSASFIAIAPAAPRNFHQHDLVTIIVREETTYQSDGTSDLEKKYDFDAKLDAWIKLKLSNLQIQPTAAGSPEMKGSADRKVQNDGKVKRADSFVGRITAEVVDVKPNGTLLLAARKFIKTDDEEQQFELTGACRVEDVNADNTVLSTQLADLTVRKTHAGQVRDTTRRGLFPKAIDWVNPW